MKAFDFNRFEVRHDEAEKMLKCIGDLLREACPKGYGFSLLIFSFAGGYDENGIPLGNMFYTSNAERESMIAAMREFIQKFESN
jgi:hypothetical protein